MKLPICHKCKRKIDHLAKHENYKTNETIWVAECHGSKEVVRLPNELRYEISGIGYAFQPSLQEQIKM